MTHIQEDPRHRDPQNQSIESRSETIVPVWQEELHVETRVVDTGKGVRIHKTVSEEERIVDPPLMHEELSVERVPIGKWVESGMQPKVRYEGDTLIVPVLEEVLVVEKKLRLKEELRIIRQRHETRAPHSVVLRSEKVSVERFDPSGGASDQSGEADTSDKA
jgi:uncharacterized protein (TIGR02271 family)